MRSWPIWALPRNMLATVAAVEVAAVTVVLATFGGPLPALPAVLDALLLGGLGILHTELAVGLERMRLLAKRPTHVGLSSVWTSAAALHLHLSLAAAVAVVVQGHMWLRAGHVSAPLYKHVFTTATVVLACAAAGAVVRAAPSDAADGLVTLVVALIAYTLVNSGLIAVAVKLSGTAPPGLAALVGDGDENMLEIATLALGALVALALPVSPWLVPLALPPVLVLHRAVLVRQLEEAAITDGKTGLLTAHAWSVRAEDELRRAVPEPVPHAVLVLDLDHFKRVNDEHGHLVGDQVLAAVADALRAEVRDCDLVGRFGGEEFVVLLVGPQGGHEADLATVADRIRQRVAELVVDVVTAEGRRRIDHLSVSVGGALHPGGRAELERLLRTADTALYSAKRAGRNRVRMGLVLPDPPRGG